MICIILSSLRLSQQGTPLEMVVSQWKNSGICSTIWVHLSALALLEIQTHSHNWFYHSPSVP